MTDVEKDTHHKDVNVIVQQNTFVQYEVHYLDDSFHCKVQTCRPPSTMLIFKNTCLIRDDEQEP